jgi:K+/H+ antiporter YhaU regulatory subunit KhtT
MTFDLMQRIKRELFVTGTALYETVLAIAERVNRKAEILHLHWQATHLGHSLDQLHREVGLSISSRASTIGNGDRLSGVTVDPDLIRRLQAASVRSRQLKQAVLKLDGLIRQLKQETAQENLLKLQQDLLARSLSLERVVIEPGSFAEGRHFADCQVPDGVHLVAIMRGPSFVTVPSDLVLKAQDILVVIGSQEGVLALTSQGRNTAMMARVTVRS